MQRRSWLTDLAGLGLLAWAVLLGYVSVPWILSRGVLWDGGISMLGAALAAAHLVAALGVTRRAPWARRLGLWMAGVGLFGSGVVLLTLFGSLTGPAAPATGASPLLVLAIPAGMVAVYALILILLLRAQGEFTRIAG
jgi:hypothetical protein